jgi:quinol monooxygenase YgiN
MFLVQRIFTRPAADVPFYATSDAYKAAFQGYKDSGKVLSFTANVSGDKLKFVVNTMWKDEAAHQEYMADAVTQAMIAERNAYNAAHNITDEKVTDQL